MKLSPPQEVIALAAALGSDSTITQGPGGNVSMKEGGVLWVKASGTQMAFASSQDIFVPIDLRDARDKIRSSSVNFESLHPKSFLRPSIETAMHALIDAPFVAHVHSLGSLSVSALKDYDFAIKLARNLCKISAIPYVKPGIELAKSIENVLSRETSALLLGNHGLTVSGDSPSQCQELITDLENIWRTRIFSQANTNDEWIKILLGGALFPDQLLFLGNECLIFNPLAKDVFGLLTDFGAQRIKQAPWLVDFLKVLEEVARSGATINEMRYLTRFECNELLNWDAEKFRKEQVE
jgi:ribulose-5-phosphate 4-epimerase/fuculose-1-phosphate aldolase